MSSQFDPRSLLKYMGPNQHLVPFTQRETAPRAPLTASPDVYNPGGGYYEISTIWRDKSTNDFYILVEIANNLAHWEKFTGATGTTVTISDTAGTKVDPDGTGNIQLFGQTKNVIVTADVPNNRLILSLPAATAAGQVLMSDGSGGYDPVFLTPQINNLGFTLSAGTFTVTSANGTALSATNPAFVTLQRKSPNSSQTKTYRITTTSSFVDSTGGVPTLTVSLFGTLNTDLWNQDMPFYLYAVAATDESDVQFMISRDPSARVSSATVGKPGVGAAGQFDFWAFNAAITVANYQNQPCLLLGAFRMRKTVAAGSWQVQSLTQNDGIGQYHEQTWFTMPTGIFGAAASNHFINGGGTAPSNTPIFYVYRIGRDGYVDVQYETNCTGAGVGAIQATMIIPYNFSVPGGSATFLINNGSGFLLDASVNLTINLFIWKTGNTGSNFILFPYQGSTATYMSYNTLATGDIVSFSFRAKLY